MRSLFGVSNIRWPIALVLSSIAFASAATAQQNDDTGSAAALFRDATRLYNEQRYGEAFDRYRRSYRLDPRAKTLGNMARTLVDLGREAEAATLYDKYLHEPSVDPAVRERTASYLRQLDQRLAVVAVQTTPPDAEVAVDGRDIEPGLARRLRLAPGAHTIAVRRKGYRAPAPVTLSMQAGQRYVVPLALAPEPPSVAVLPETAPERDTSISPPERSRYRIPAYVAGGVAAGALAAGAIVLGTVAPAYNDRKAAQCPSSPCPTGTWDDLEPRANLGYGLLAAGGALAVTDAVLWVLVLRHRPGEKPRTARIVPSGAGIAVHGSF